MAVKQHEKAILASSSTSKDTDSKEANNSNSFGCRMLGFTSLAIFINGNIVDNSWNMAKQLRELSFLSVKEGIIANRP